MYWLSFKDWSRKEGKLFLRRRLYIRHSDGWESSWTPIIKVTRQFNLLKLLTKQRKKGTSLEQVKVKQCVACNKVLDTKGIPRKYVQDHTLFWCLNCADSISIAQFSLQGEFKKVITKYRCSDCSEAIGVFKNIDGTYGSGGYVEIDGKSYCLACEKRILLRDTASA